MLTAGAIAGFFTTGLSIQARRNAAQAECAQRGACANKGEQADIQAARATEDIVDLTIIQMVFGAVGLALVGWTLQATRAAVREANDATEAARRAVDVTEAAAREQLRAYVGAGAVNYHFVDNGMAGGAFSASAQITNFGQTPARCFRSLAAIRIVDFPITAIPEVGLPQGGTHTLLPTMQTVTTVSTNLTGEMVMRLRNNHAAMFFTVIVEYRDHVGRRHIERARLYGPQRIEIGQTHGATMIFHSGDAEEAD
jgi:hypothetical protein